MSYDQRWSAWSFDFTLPSDAARKVQMSELDYWQLSLTALNAIAAGLTVNVAIGDVTVIESPGAAFFLPTNLTANVGGTTTLAARATRRSVSITCPEASPEAIRYGAASGFADANGALLMPGDSQSLDSTAAVWFKSAGGTGTVLCVETWDTP